MDRLLLILATLAFVGGLVHAVISLRAGTWKENRWHWVPMAVGLVFQTAFLYLRGQQHGRCPLTNLFEVFIFIGWCIVLLYFLVGATYRLSLLGVFTAPMIALLQALALVSSLDKSVPPLRGPPNPWLEIHAAISLMAYAAFALACITGVMYLVQARLLKEHRIHSLFYQLPPIHELAKAIQRLAILGTLLLSAGLAASIPLHIPVSNPKLIFAWIVWGLYLAINVIMWARMLSARQTAWLAVVGFVVPLVSVWMVTKAS
ncbi:MAG: ccmC [Verrucomicrobiaceae bacterium]|nr:ccmC [Verrucomicrobiaceae bacterium]